MRFDTNVHEAYCGLDLHVRTMYVCLLNRDGEILLHRNMPTTPEIFLKAIAPYRQELAVAVECLFTWYWLADLGVQEGLTFVLGHAQYMKAIHGGKAKNDRLDAQKSAVLLRGGMLPQAYASPAMMRATRALLRRRLHLVRQRAERLTHIRHIPADFVVTSRVLHDCLEISRCPSHCVSCPSRKPEDMNILDFCLSCPHPGPMHLRSYHRSS
jgi:hypothetical protein